VRRLIERVVLGIFHRQISGDTTLRLEDVREISLIDVSRTHDFFNRLRLLVRRVSSPNLCRSLTHANDRMLLTPPPINEIFAAEIDVPRDPNTRSTTHLLFGTSNASRAHLLFGNQPSTHYLDSGVTVSPSRIDKIDYRPTSAGNYRMDNVQALGTDEVSSQYVLSGSGTKESTECC